MNGCPILAARAPGLLLVLVVGCMRLATLPAEPPERAVDINVNVVATPGCKLKLHTVQNACKGVGQTNGVACGRPEDTVRWTSNNATIDTITFAAGDQVVCGQAGVEVVGQARACELARQDITDDQGVAFKYLIRWTFQGDRCELDPYVIVTKR
jgi:hypothetical protein